MFCGCCDLCFDVCVCWRVVVCVCACLFCVVGLHSFVYLFHLVEHYVGFALCLSCLVFVMFSVCCVVVCCVVVLFVCLFCACFVCGLVLSSFLCLPFLVVLLCLFVHFVVSWLLVFIVNASRCPPWPVCFWLALRYILCFDLTGVGPVFRGGLTGFYKGVLGEIRLVSEGEFDRFYVGPALRGGS